MNRSREDRELSQFVSQISIGATVNRSLTNSNLFKLNMPNREYSISHRHISSIVFHRGSISDYYKDRLQTVTEIEVRVPRRVGLDKLLIP